MIARIIEWSLRERLLVLLLSAGLGLWGLHALNETPVDAIPDLSDVQVIVKTSYPGQAPRVVEDQVTYPLTTALLAVPGATTVRGYSFFGDSYVYVIFEDGTDLYWARSRVLEYLNQVAGQLPPEVRPALGPDATGVGWVYEYALVDRSGGHDLSQMRSLQDWFLRFELQSLPGVAEVATIGGMVRQYQVVIDPERLSAYGLTLARVRDAIQRSNQEAGGSVIEMAEAEYMVRATGYLTGADDLREVLLMVTDVGTPVLLGDVADVSVGPQLRRGVADLDGEGEVVGGIVVMRQGGNARDVIRSVRDRLAILAESLPPGVEVVTTYDRSALIERAVGNLRGKLIEEFLIVALVCAVFLFHLRSSLVIVLSLPLGILGAFAIMRMQGMSANIMSLGGIAIAIGTMVDAAIVMIENLHKHLERDPAEGEARWRVIGRAASEVGPALFGSLLIITLSFLPVFTLEAQEGRLFAPLAYTKTFAMAVAAGLSITLVPVLMGYLIRGRIRPEHENPVNRVLLAGYRPLLDAALRWPRSMLVGAAMLVLVSAWPLSQLGSEFMPPLDEGDLLYMPTTDPGISIGKARQLLQQTDRLIASVPEVLRVFGKVGRADTATDPAPLTMIETTITLRPHEEWRPGMTTEDLIAELDRVVDVPGVTNAWVMPIRTRIDMLATGIRTPVGIKVAGADLAVIQSIGAEIERILPQVRGTASVYAERSAGGRYLTVDLDRARAARYGIAIADAQDVIRGAVGGMTVTRTVEGLERYPVNLRYPQALRDSLAQLSLLPIVTPSGARVALADIADLRIEDGPPMIRSEAARPSGWIFVDIRDRDLGTYVAAAQDALAQELELPPGYSLSWSGQYEYLARAEARLAVVAPLTLAVIVLLLFLIFRQLPHVLMILGTLPLAAVGSVWLLRLLDYDLSVAVGVGFIALAGVAVEIGVVMLLYLDQSAARHPDASGESLVDAVREGALLRMRPVMMTVATIIAGLLPIMLGSGTGSEVMRRIAAPMVGGMVSATLLTLLVVPAAYLLWWRSVRR